MLNRKVTRNVVDFCEQAMSIAGGNWRIFDHMLKSSNAISTHLNTTVAQVSKQSNGSYSLTFSSAKTKNFDEVILAAPLQFSNMAIDPAPHHTPDKIPYVKLHVTHFATPHNLDPSAFGLDSDKKVPEYVLTTLQSDEDYGSDPHVGRAGFFSVSVVSTGINKFASEPRQEYIYKIFSPYRVDKEFLSRILGLPISKEEAKSGDLDGNISWINHWEVHSYPYEYPRVTFDEIELDDGLWYTSSMESFISTMETSALSGKNVAALMASRWKKDRKEVQAEENLGFEPLGAVQQPLKEIL